MASSHHTWLHGFIELALTCHIQNLIKYLNSPLILETVANVVQAGDVGVTLRIPSSEDENFVYSNFTCHFNLPMLVTVSVILYLYNDLFMHLPITETGCRKSQKKRSYVY